MKSSTRAALLVAALLVAVFLLNVFTRVPISVLYAVPMLAAAQLLTPRATLFVCVTTLLLYVLDLLIERSPLALAEVREFSLVAVAFLSYLLAVRMEQVRNAMTESEMTRQELQNFLGLVAHDLRGPLTAILGYAQLACRPGVGQQTRQEALATIQDEARRMDRLVADLLDAARIGAGQFKIEPRPMDLVELAQRVVKAVQGTTSQHQIVLEAPDRLEVRADPDRLEQVLGNLLSNAIKYSPAGGPIRVEVLREDQVASVAVTDQGVGIRREDLPLLFKPFSRVYAGREARGAGLGLYISHAIIEAHGGRLWAESPGPGKGSTFKFTLPLGAAPAAASASAAGRSAS